MQLLQAYQEHPQLRAISTRLTTTRHFHLRNLLGSSRAVLAAALQQSHPAINFFILPDKESAAYFLNDLEQVFGEQGKPLPRKKVLFFPTAYKRPYEMEKVDNNNILHRTEVLKRISGGSANLMIVSFPEALSEKVITKSYLSKNIIRIKAGEEISQDFLYEVLVEYGFEQVDFVVEPGQFSLRGGIVDVFSFSNDFPYRIEFFDDEVESIRAFDPTSQRSLETLNRIQILPNMQERTLMEKRQGILEFLPPNIRLWVVDMDYAMQRIDEEFAKAKHLYAGLTGEVKRLEPELLFSRAADFEKALARHIILEPGRENSSMMPWKSVLKPVCNPRSSRILNCS
jgi:transcription-repair coupling factor (superfamily II helicase)